MSKSKIILDIQAIHMNDMGGIVGDYHGTPIRQWDPKVSQHREDADLLARLAFNQETTNVPLS